jgi:MoaA/NifB/PqqE/SkfB family radical SAM enzyme
MGTSLKRLDIKIGYTCNNRCRFCAQGDKRSFCAARGADEVLRELGEARANGFGGVVFTGGEATLHPDLLDFVREAKRLKYESIQLQTNGRMLAYRELCERLLEAGVNEFGPSIHGSRPAVHEDLTRAEGSWRQTVAGIRNLKSLGAYVLTNTVVTSRNYEDLPDLARLLVRLGADSYQFAFVHIVGTAWENREWIVPRMTAVMPHVRRGLEVGLSAGRQAYTEAIPLCMMSGLESCVAESIIPDTAVVDSRRVEDFGHWRRTEGKAKGPPCGRCGFSASCEGPWKEYPELYGWEEFRPV